KLEIKVENELKKLDALADEPTSAISSEVKPIIALGEGNKPIPKVELTKTMFGGYSVEPEQIESLKEYTNSLKHENSDLRDALEESKDNYTRLRKSYLNAPKMLDKLVEDKTYTERSKPAREPFKYDKPVGSLSSALTTLENENKELRKENRVLQQWRAKA